MNRTLKYILCLFTGVLMAYSTQAETPQQIFDKANRMYEREAYDSAMMEYTQLEESGYLNEALFFNAGNTAYKMNKAGYAIYYYTKALQEDPGNKKYIHNLHLAQIKAFDKTQPNPKIFIVRWWHNVLHFFSINTWMILSLIFFWILLFLIAWQVLSVAPPKVIKKSRLPVVLLFFFCFVCAFFSLNSFKSHDSGIIVSSDPIKEAPDTNSQRLGMAQAGKEVKVVNSVQDWKKIKLSDGTEGWIKDKTIKIL